ncbi:MAG: hypothetical protein PGN07_03050 [Aeromicrobium erythreum]
MPLTFEPDVSVADWVVGAGGDRAVLATQGPPGLAAHARVRHAGPDREAAPDPDLVAEVARLGAAHTTTPEDAFFALWDGWGELHEGRVYASMDPGRHFGRMFRRDAGPRTLPAFGPEVMDGPRARLADLGYLVFRGPLAAAGDWGARPYTPDWPRDLPPAAFTWPADRAWCIAADVDPDWFTVGGSRAFVDAVVARPDLDAAPVPYGLDPSQEPA